MSSCYDRELAMEETVSIDFLHVGGSTEPLIVVETHLHGDVTSLSVLPLT